MYTFSLPNKKDVPVADIRMESVYCIVFIKNTYFPYFTCCHITSFWILEDKNNQHWVKQMGGLTKTRSPIQSNRASGFVLFLTLFRNMYFCSFLDSFEVHFCPEKTWAHPLKICPIQASLVWNQTDLRLYENWGFFVITFLSCLVLSCLAFFCLVGTSRSRGNHKAYPNRHYISHPTFPGTERPMNKQRNRLVQSSS